MELRHLRYFVAVAEELNFSRAAERLAMTQPSLSRQMQDLEGELGVELLVRQPRQLLLTPAGKFFLEQARSLLDAADQAVEQTRLLGRGETGQLTLGYNTDQAGCGLLPAILRNFRQQYPNVSLNLRSMELSGQIAALKEREIDLGFCIRLGKEEYTPDFKELCWENLSSDTLEAALPAGHELARQEKVGLAELAAQPFIWSSAQLNPLTGDYTPTLFEEAGFRPQRFVTGYSRSASPLEMISQGRGVSLAHADDTRPEGVVLRPLVEEFFGSHTMFWRCDQVSPTLKAFIELAATIQQDKSCHLRHF